MEHQRADAAATTVTKALRGARPAVTAGPMRRALARCAGPAALAGACLMFLGGVASAGTSAWTFEPVPKPPRTATSLYSVSCPARGECTAVGASPALPQGNSTLMAAHWNGTSWTPQHVPMPKGAINAFLFGVACPTTTDCTAVGWNSSGGTLPFAEQWDGTAWQPTSVPLPAGGVQGGLSSVSCASPDNCTAVGWRRQHELGRDLPLAEHWNGTVWTAQHLPFVKNANGSLGGVSCPTTAYCVATGAWSIFGQNTALFAERWNGTKWTFQNLPIPAGATFGLGSVSCVQPGHCVAVGGSSSSTAYLASIVERMTGKNWTLQPDAAPAQSVLWGVSCPSSRACTAVGGTEQPGTAFKTGVAEHWNGSTWARQALPLPPKASGTILSGVDCLTAQYCTAAGDAAVHGGPNGYPVADHEG